MTRQYLVKASWRGTALKFWISGRSVEDAIKRAERDIKKRDGWETCLGVEVIDWKEAE